MAEHFREAGHLPNRREGGEPASPERLPRQRNGVTPQMHGRYPDYNVLDEAEHWDPVTRKVVMDRVDQAPPIRFFTGSEAATLRAFCDVVTAQDREPKIPVLNMIDAKLAAGELDGFQHHDMPDDRDTWRLVARGLDEAAAHHGASSFAAAPPEVQHAIVKGFADGEPEGEVWADLPPPKAWGVVMRMVLSAFYSHPWAWNEIGFGGPAYPRGYARFGVGQREWWEGEEAVDVDPVVDVDEQGGE